MDKDEIIEQAVAGVQRAVGYCGDVEFSPEDASRTEADFLCQVVEAAIAAGATTVNIPDTVGYATPSAHGQRHPHAAQPRAQHRQGGDQRPLPQRPGHGRGQQPGRRRSRRGPGRMHDQRPGRAGRQLLAGRDRHGPADPRTTTIMPPPASITSRLVPTSRLVANITGIQVQRNKAIVGQNAFAHEAGIHQDGMLKERTTYEIMRPEDVGFAMSDLVLGKHSGRAALADRAKAMGYTLTGEQLRHGLRAVQDPGRQEEGNLRRRHRRPDRAADARRDRTLDVGLVPGDLRHRPGARGDAPAPPRRGETSTATIAGGDGPIDAVFLAIEQADGHLGRLPRLQRPQRHGGQGRPGRGAGPGGARGPSCIAAAASRPTASRPARRRF